MNKLILLAFAVGVALALATLALASPVKTQYGNQTTTLKTEVVAAPPKAALPHTGFDVTYLLLVGGTLASVGGLGILAGRRRK